MNTCIQCLKWKEKQEEVLMKCESVFDASVDMEAFEESCKKTCQYSEKNTENS